jgi:hypothetical protein
MTPETPFDESPAEGISRRKVLKRIGAGAAIAWTAPVLTSLRTPAFAQSPECQCPPADCNNFATCDNGCLCAPHHGGGPCICWLSGFCSGIGQNLCANDQDCVNQFGPGWQCGDINPDTCDSICHGDNTACLDPTGCTSSRAQGRRTGMKALH